MLTKEGNSVMMQGMAYARFVSSRTGTTSSKLGQVWLRIWAILLEEWFVETRTKAE